MLWFIGADDESNVPYHNRFVNLKSSHISMAEHTCICSIFRTCIMFKTIIKQSTDQQYNQTTLELNGHLTIFKEQTVGVKMNI